MDRSDILLVGCGGGGNRTVDTILDTDQRFMGYFINSSKTDIESLNNYDDIIKNYFCTSQNNGTGRDRFLGKRYASKNGYRIIDALQKFDQKVIFLVSSFGGGSGSSTISVLLNAINEMKKDGDFDKTVNLIGILPKLESPNIILQNTIDTWNEIIDSKCINNMIFIDNNNTIDGSYLEENIINENFAELFDSIFEIPNINGTKFDNANLGNIIKSKGCTYIYNLPNGCENIENALKQADNNSVLAKMYKTKELIRVGEDGNERISCGYIGTSFNDENYSHEDILKKYEYTEEDYSGYNEQNNLLLVTGMLPPFYSIQVIKAELDDRQRNKSNDTLNNFSKFTLDYPSKENNSKGNTSSVTNSKPKDSNSKNKGMKKVMKKNLFDM